MRSVTARCFTRFHSPVTASCAMASCHITYCRCTPSSGELSSAPARTTGVSVSNTNTAFCGTAPDTTRTSYDASASRASVFMRTLHVKLPRGRQLCGALSVSAGARADAARRARAAERERERETHTTERERATVCTAAL